jgi:tetratricopeptide (TPR) repeat protein
MSRRISSFANLMFAGFLLLSFLTGRSQDLKNAINLTRNEQFFMASSAFKQLIRENPSNGDLYFYYGDSFLDRYLTDTINYDFGRLSDSARIQFDLGIQNDPNNPLNYVGRGELNLLHRKPDLAQPEFAKAISLLPSKANKSIQMAPERHAKVLIKIADAYIKAEVNDTTQIFSLLRAAEKLNPKDPEIYLARGDAYFYLLNDGSKAISNYNYVQVLEPKSPEAKLKTGQLWMRARNYKDAMSTYQEVIKLDSTYAPAYRALGYLLSRANRNAEAKKYFEKFLELSKGNIGARIQYVLTLFELQDYKEALVQLKEVYKADSSVNDFNRALAYAYYETAAYDKGLYYMRKFFKNENPDNLRPNDYAYYGRLLAKNKLDSLAPEMLLKAYAKDTNRIELISEAALCWTKVKKYDKSLEVYDMKLKLNKVVPMDYYNIGKIYYNMQNFDKADTNLAIFLAAQPDYIPAWGWRARTKSNIDSDSKLGLAKPIYETILEKTQSDTVKYVRDRCEALYYLSFYYFQQFNQTKQKDFAFRATEYSNWLLAVDPKDVNAEKAKQIIDVLKKFIN